MVGMLIAYDAAGNVVGTMDYLVRYDENRQPLGLVDFAAHEEAGGQVTDYLTISHAKGAKVWPEWLGSRAHEFKVELSGPPGQKRISALVHKESGHRRERADVEAAIESEPVDEWTLHKDIRHIVGGPQRPVHLDEDGRRTERPKAEPNSLPLSTVTVPAGP